jgi:hypothetical protein
VFRLLQQWGTLNSEVQDRDLPAQRVITVARRPAHGVCYTQEAIEQIVAEARGIVVGIGRGSGLAGQRVARACAPQHGVGCGALRLGDDTPVGVIALRRNDAARRCRRGRRCGREQLAPGIIGFGGNIAVRIRNRNDVTLQ